jgi:hypothetical protein
MLLHPVSALLIFPIDFLATYVLRQRPEARYPFNDLKNKKKYREFYERYKEVYNRVRRTANPATSSGPAAPAAGAAS